MLRKMMRRTESVVQRWEEWGINMKPTGKYNFEGTRCHPVSATI